MVGRSGREEEEEERVGRREGGRGSRAEGRKEGRKERRKKARKEHEPRCLDAVYDVTDWREAPQHDQPTSTSPRYGAIHYSTAPDGHLPAAE